jgi:hypothetical protein
LIGNIPSDDDPFSGLGAHKGWQFSPSGEILCQLTDWAAPAVEYYGDMGSLEDMRGLQHQQHFLDSANSRSFPVPPPSNEALAVDEFGSIRRNLTRTPHALANRPFDLERCRVRLWSQSPSDRVVRQAGCVTEPRQLRL